MMYYVDIHRKIGTKLNSPAAGLFVRAEISMRTIITDFETSDKEQVAAHSLLAFSRPEACRKIHARNCFIAT